MVEEGVWGPVPTAGRGEAPKCTLTAVKCSHLLAMPQNCREPRAGSGAAQEGKQPSCAR